MLFTGTSNVCGRRQGLNLLGRHVRVGSVEIQRMDEMRRGPLDEGVWVIGDRSGRRIVHVLEDGIEHRPCRLGQAGHERTEFAVEVAEKQQSLLTQDREARGVNRADSILRLEQPRHEWRKLLGQSFGVRGRLQGKAQSKVALTHSVISFVWILTLIRETGILDFGPMWPVA